MDFQIPFLIITYIFIFMVFLLQLIKPYVTSNDIVFGIRLDDDLVNSSEVGFIKKRYIKMCLSILGVYTLIFFACLYFLLNNIVLFFGLLVFMVIWFIIYYAAHKRINNIKKRKTQIRGCKEQVVIVDTNFRNKKHGRLTISEYLFFIPIAVILVNILIGFIEYDKLPIFVPTHWNCYGNVDGAVLKSYGTIFIFPLMQAYLTVLLFILNKAIGRSKQNVNIYMPLNSIENDRIFRYRWSVFIIIFDIITVLLLSLLNMYILCVIKLPVSFIIFSMPVLYAIALTAVIIMELYTGQGGSRLSHKISEKNSLLNSEINDDKLWKLGLIYFNKNDPALFVENRFGIGWGINFGRVESYLFIASIIAFYFIYNYILMFAAYPYR